ncbi:MAG: TPM domain-containing protein [Parasporobacterium sp.]|nr:TPM domain-containing protein [Parasporobacterium sp.]
MIKKITTLFAALLLCLAFPIAVLADGNAEKLVDNAGLLSESEASIVTESLEKVSDKYDADIAILTTNGLDGKSIQNFSDDYYDQNGYGTGDEKSGVLWVIDMDSRETYVTTSGEGIAAVTDYGKDLLASEVNPYLSSGDYVGAMNAYADTINYFFEQERAGTPVDTYGKPAEKKETGVGTYVIIGIVCLGIGFAISFAITGSMKKKMKSVRRQSTANAYADQNGLNLMENTDRYLYNRVVAVPLPKNDSSGGGGSSTHISSSGSTHGGGSLGKF